MAERQFNDLTPAEAERLFVLMEEMGESIQAIGKILRHGYESCHPNLDAVATNRRSLEQELGHVTYAVAMMWAAGDLSRPNIDAHTAAKSESIKPYLHHQPKEVTNES